jgi:hypothetical protein
MSGNNRNHRIAVGTAFAAAILASTTVARADDMQISIDGLDLFPTAGNTATATSATGDIAIAIGSGADADATGGIGDFAYVDGANSIAEAGHNGDFDTALVSGTNSTAEAGFGVCGLLCAFPGPGGIYFPTPHYEFDTAAAFGNALNADATSGSFVTDIQPAIAAAVLPAAAPAADGPDPFEDLFTSTGINSWTPAADASLLSSDPSLAATLDTSVENYMSVVDQIDPVSQLTAEIDPSAFTYSLELSPTGDYIDVPIPQDGVGELALGTDYLLSLAGIDDFGNPLNFPSLIIDVLFFPEIFLLAGA